MTDDQLDPEQEEYLRRLLADARHEDPIPSDVADRLDDVLAALATEPTEEPTQEPTAPVVDLDTQQRRRRARQLLVAAAAVVAVGVGLSQLDLGSISTQMSADNAGAGSDTTSYAEKPEAAGQSANGPRRAAPTPTAQRVQIVTDRELRELGKTDLRADFNRSSALAYTLFDALVPTSASGTDGVEAEVDGGAGAAAGDSPRDGDLQAASWYTCKPGRYGEGRLLAVEYDGNSAVLAVRPSAGDSVVVEVLQCGTATVLRSVTVPTP